MPLVRFVGNRSFQTEKFGKTTWDKKFSDAFLGILDEETFGRTLHQSTSMNTKIYVETNNSSIINIRVTCIIIITSSRTFE